MKIQGHEVTPEQIAAMVEAMAGEFRMYKIQGAGERAGVPLAASMRVVDCLLQRERRAGRIRHVSAGKWIKI